MLPGMLKRNPMTVSWNAGCRHPDSVPVLAERLSFRGMGAIMSFETTKTEQRSCLQGRVKFPTGSIVCRRSGAGSGEIPGPTVESGLKKVC